jgi:5-methylthioadenosine/S-adenosylhomocysteine deaminase
VIPGLVDAHAHMRLTGLRGGAQDVPEIEWMNDALAPLAHQLDRDEEVLGARLGAIEAVLAGATTVCEYARNAETLVEEVYDPLGVRVVASETINEITDERDDLGPRDLPRLDRSLGEQALERTEQLFDRYADNDRVSVTYGPQAVDMVSPETLREVARRSAERDRDVHMHVAQGEREHLQVEERYGEDASSVSVLEDTGLANDRLIAAHLHDATPDERERLAQAGVRMVGCPSSIGAIDGVVPPVLEYSDYGGVVGLGTDQAPGTGRHDVLQEARTIGMLTKCDRRDPRALPAWQALRLATVGGARALGIDDRVGTIEEGKRADLALVDLTATAMTPAVETPFRTAVPNLVYAAAGTAIDVVLVDGEVLVRDGEFLGADVDALVRRVTERAREVFAAGAEDWRAAGSALVDDADAGRF